MPRRLRSTVAALFIASAMATPAVAQAGTPANSRAHGASLLTWQERWFAWGLGSSTNPLFSGICGEQIGKLFFLNTTFEAGTEIDCQIRPGTPLLASPGGTVAWAPRHGQTREELLAARDRFLSTLSDPRATLDGRSLGNLDETLRLTDVYTIPLEPGNLIQAIDPGFSGDQTQVASAGWFLRLRPLAPGPHELVLSDRINGALLDITFHITVPGS
jgi:hypothetical protein